MSKSAILLAMSVLFIATGANAQTSIGFVGGLNLANVSFDDGSDAFLRTDDFSYRTLYGFGSVLDFRVRKMLYLRFEPMYLQRGANGPEQFVVGEEEGERLRYKFSYFEVPILMRVDVPIGSIRPYALLGTSIGFLLTAKVRQLVIGVGMEPGSPETDLKDSTKDIDWGLGIGAGFSFPLGSASVFLESRYVHGLVRLNDIGFKNRSVHIMAGVTFALGRR